MNAVLQQYQWTTVLPKVAALSAPGSASPVVLSSPAVFFAPAVICLSQCHSAMHSELARLDPLGSAVVSAAVQIISVVMNHHDHCQYYC